MSETWKIAVIKIVKVINIDLETDSEHFIAKHQWLHLNLLNEPSYQGNKGILIFHL